MSHNRQPANRAERSIAARLTRAVCDRDAREIRDLLGIMRFGFGWDYQWCYRAAADVTGVGLAEWDALIIEADLLESR